MGFEIKDEGKGNRIETAGASGDARITVRGDRNEVLLGPGTSLADSKIAIRGSDNVVAIGRNCAGIINLGVGASGAEFSMGDGTRVLEGSFRLGEPHRMALGSGCVLSEGFAAWVSDMHSVFGQRRGERINAGSDVVLGDRVWIGMRVLVLKGVTIGSGSVIGAGSVVVGEVPPNCIAAGNWARVLRRGVTWVRDFRIEELRASAGGELTDLS